MRSITLFFALTLCRWTAAQPAERAGQWQQDLQFFAERFPASQKDFGKLYDRAAFDAEVASLKAGAGTLSDAVIALRLMKLVASAKVAHTYVAAPPYRLFRRLPLTFTWYADGLAVTGAPPPYAAALGARVVRIGAMTPDQVLASAAPYLSHETEGGLRTQTAQQLTSLELLQQAGAAGAGEAAEFTLARPGAEAFTLTVQPADPRTAGLQNMFDALHLPVPLYRKNPERYYWYEYLAESKALYIQYDRCQNQEGAPFAGFARELFAFADSHPVERVIVDLRFNGGGYSRLMNPLTAGLKSRASLRSRIFVLIGAGTFSSAVMNAIDLRRELHAVLVGEAASEKLNSYGEVKSFRLPNSNLRVQYSTQFFRMDKDAGPAALEPDVRVPRTLADTLVGRDAALETALAHLKP
jgi:hypothetical protein